MTTHKVSDSVKCLDGVDYEVVKRQTHFEWVSEFEKTIKDIGVTVFDTLGVNNENALKIAVSHLDKFQENLPTKMDALVKQVTDKANVNTSAKTFVAEWADACKYQVSLKYHHIGDGPTAQKIRWGFESAIKYIIICATHLATKDDDVEFKKLVSNFVKDVIIQCLIDELKYVEKELEALKNSSS